MTPKRVMFGNAASKLAERLSVREEAIQQETSVAIAKRFEDELHASPR